MKGILSLVKLKDSVPREVSVELHLKHRLEAVGGKCIKIKPYIKGLPDRLCVWPFGPADLVETKRPKGSRFEPLQQRTHAELLEIGHEVPVLHTRAEVDAYCALRIQECLSRMLKGDVTKVGTGAKIKFHIAMYKRMTEAYKHEDFATGKMDRRPDRTR